MKLYGEYFPLLPFSFSFPNSDTKFTTPFIETASPS